MFKILQFIEAPHTFVYKSAYVCKILASILSFQCFVICMESEGKHVLRPQKILKGVRGLQGFHGTGPPKSWRRPWWWLLIFIKDLNNTYTFPYTRKRSLDWEEINHMTNLEHFYYNHRYHTIEIYTKGYSLVTFQTYHLLTFLNMHSWLRI